ncbi:hypothetical protein KYC5002_37405 [Archangium violaceum]|uniref:hypothetical protein n=1 Tax=Archangium violaceum TaxID=83451 RepID=UPI002B2E8F72|nr:hypothetical protein KYC5002_37405 [Archangium gephyra]
MQPQQEVQTRPAVLPQQEVDTLMQDLRELYKDAPDYIKHALEELREGIATIPETLMERAGRIGARQGVVSELTVIAPFAKGGAKRLRKLLELTHGNFSATEKVGSVHDMRFVFLENDTKMLFATAYDGDWDDYLDDFVAKIPNELDVIFWNFEGWPGIHNPGIKDFIARFQVAAEAWYVSNPRLSVPQAKRLEKIDKALDEFLDKIS